MKALIIEDEIMAAKSLRKLLGQISPETEILAILESVEDSVEWLKKNPMPDLMFMDIHLADGSSFTIFDKVNVTCPVIFTTAYDEYALKAFEVNSIDYLLKPLNKEALGRAIQKYHNMAENRVDTQRINTLLAELSKKPKFRTCFLLPERDKLIPLSVDDIAYVYIDSKTVKMVSLESKAFYISHTLDDLMSDLDPQVFFRANRQFIISRRAVKDVSVWFGNKLAINLVVETPEKIIVSKARVGEFKSWFSA